MKHPSFDIITALGQAGFGRPDPETLQVFRDKVSQMRIYIPGDRIDMPAQRTATRFSLDHGLSKALPSLSMYLRETDAIKAHGPNAYFPAKLRIALLFAQSFRADVWLVQGEERMRICHQTLLELHDMNGMGKPMAQDEVVAQREAMLKFAARARVYCARQVNVKSLHLATLATSGGKPVLVGALSAEQYARHAVALKEISMDLFLPSWRFVLLDEAGGHAALIKELRETPPCYVKVAGQGWWNKIKNQFQSPAPSLAGLTLG